MDWYAHSFPSAEAKSKGSVTNGDKSYQLTLNSECNTDFLAQKQSPTPTHAYMNTSYSQCSMFLTVAVFSLESLVSSQKVSLDTYLLYPIYFPSLLLHFLMISYISQNAFCSSLQNAPEHFRYGFIMSVQRAIVK